MQIYLITGLDGSGKSTLFKRLKEAPKEQTAFLHLPYIDLTELPNSFPHRSLCERLNEMGTNADTLQLPLLKIYALFGAMSLYSSIRISFEQVGKKILFCERHPLIDSPVYALAYRSYMHPKRWNDSVFNQLDELYATEMTQISELVSSAPLTGDSPSKHLLHFINDLFGKQTPTLQKLETVFACQSPDFIYFLDASPPILLNRLAQRVVKEHHEQETQLAQMRLAYLDSLAAFPQVTLVDAASFAALDRLAEQFTKH